MLNLQKSLDKAVAEYGVPGAVALVGNKEGNIASAKSGFSDPESTQPMKLDAIFQIASMTKAITSVAAMQLVERNLLSLDDPIDTILPDLANPHIIVGFNADDKAQLQPGKTAITLRHLLTHTAGLGYSFTSAEMAKAQGPVAPGSLASIRSPLLFEPGTEWLYGVSTDWVGRAVEAVSAQSLGDYMQANILAPLGMEDTAFDVPPEKLDRRVALLSLTGDTFMPFPIEIGGGEMAEFQSGGAGLYSTAADYMMFMRMILNEGILNNNRILSAESIAEMSRNQVGALRAGLMESAIPALSVSYDTFPEIDTKWGLGTLIIPEKGPHGRAAGTLSWAGIANCYYWIDPASNLAALVLMQYMPFGEQRATSVLNAVESAIYDAH